MILDLLKTFWKPLGVIVLAALLFLGGGFLGYRAGENDRDRDWQTRWSQRDAADAMAVQRQESAERAEEQRRQNEIDHVREDAQTQISTARADALRATADADRLQQTVAELQRNLRNSKTSGNTGTTGGGPATARQCDVLADVLSESVERNRQLAEEADRRRIAGQACERAYDAIRGKQ